MTQLLRREEGVINSLPSRIEYMNRRILTAPAIELQTVTNAPAVGSQGAEGAEKTWAHLRSQLGGQGIRGGLPQKVVSSDWS